MGEVSGHIANLWVRICLLSIMWGAVREPAFQDMVGQLSLRPGTEERLSGAHSGCRRSEPSRFTELPETSC